MGRRADQHQRQDGVGNMSWSNFVVSRLRNVYYKMCFTILSSQAELFLERIVTGHDTVAEPLRAPLSYKDATKIHQACGAFLFFLKKLEQVAPGSDFPEMKRALRAQFTSGFLDGDLISALEEQVPAAPELVNVRCMRPFMVFVCFFSLIAFLVLFNHRTMSVMLLDSS